MKHLLLSIFLLCGSAFGADFYFSASSAGSNNGTSCANAYAYNDGTNGWNTAGKQVAGNNLHVCGSFTFTAGASGVLNITHSGSSGNPITVTFETGAVVQAPYWGSGGFINVSGASFILIDGGTSCGYVNSVDVACNGTIQATANGSSLTNHVPNSHAINLGTGTHDIEVRNLYCKHLFVPTKNSSNNETTSGINNSACVWWYPSSSSVGNVNVHNNQIDGSFNGVLMAYVGSTSNMHVDNNWMTNIEVGAQIGAGTSGASIAVGTVNGNDFSNMGNWDTSQSCGGSCPNHHEFIHLYTQQTSAVIGSSGTPFQIANNYFHGTLGYSLTAEIYIECDSAGACGAPTGLYVDVYNNAIVNEDSTADISISGGGNGMAECEGATCRIFNNTYFASAGNSSGNNTAQHCESSSVLTVRNNIFDGMNSAISNGGCTVTANTNLGFGLANSCGASCSVSGDPLLNSSGSPKYQLQFGSAAIGAGADLTSLGLTLLNSDQLGVSRPSGSAWDMGAFQFGGGGLPVATPTFSPSGNTSYSTTQTVTIATVTSGATLRYTTSGTAPTCSSGTVYSTPVSIAATATLKAIGCKSGDTDSAVASATYTLQGSTPTALPVAGTYPLTTAQSIVLSQAQSLAMVFTIDGSTPTSDGSGGALNGTLYSGPITVSANETIKAIAMASGWTDSSVASFLYVFSAVAGAGGATLSGGVTVGSGATISAGSGGGGSPVTGEQYYVGPAGRDSNDCRSAGSLCKTVAHVESLAGTGATINFVGILRLSTANNSSSGSIAAKDGQIFTAVTCTPLSGICSNGVSGGILIGASAIGPDSNGNWHVSGMTQQGPNYGRSCDTGYNCNPTEDLFYDGVPLRHMSTGPAGLSSGQWWFDYSAHVIYFHDTPSGHIVETSVLGTMFARNGAKNVTIQYLTVEEFASQLLQGGAIDPNAGTNVSATGGTGWKILNDYITLNHGNGVRVAPGMQIRNNAINTNGELGVGGGVPAAFGDSGLVVQGNQIDGNNYAHVSPGFQAGGMKLGNTQNAVVRGNDFENNIGQALHCDVNCVGGLFDGNTIQNNVDPAGSGAASVGMTFEVSNVQSSTPAIMRNNIVLHNGTTSPQQPNPQISISNSSNTTAYCNVIETGSNTNALGWDLSSANRGTNPDSPHQGAYITAVGNSVHHNTVIFDSTTTGSVGYKQNDATNQPNFLANNTPPDYNTYHASSTSLAKFQYGGSSVNFTTYQGAGGDIHGSIDTNYNVGFPTVSIDAPADQSSGSTATVQATASDGSGIANAKLYLDWTLQQTITGGGPYTFSPVSLSVGSHVLAVMALANSGVQNCNAITVTH